MGQTYFTRTKFIGQTYFGRTNIKVKHTLPEQIFRLDILCQDKYIDQTYLYQDKYIGQAYFNFYSIYKNLLRIHIHQIRSIYKDGIRSILAPGSGSIGFATFQLLDQSPLDSQHYSSWIRVHWIRNILAPWIRVHWIRNILAPWILIQVG